MVTCTKCRKRQRRPPAGDGGTPTVWVCPACGADLALTDEEPKGSPS